MPVEVTPEIVYPDSDGKPMAENTLQFEWIQRLSGNLDALYADREDVFVKGDQLWYPVEGRPDVCQAPDVYVVFGRPKGYRGSWKQWEEDDTPMTVVFEILSPSNTLTQQEEKLHFYDTYGVEEYYVFDPERGLFWPYLRATATLVVQPMPGRRFTSSRMGVRFDLSGDDLAVFYPDGRRFVMLAESEQARQQAVQAQQHAEQARQQAEQRFARLAFLAGRVTTGQATAEEAAEFQRLLAQPSA